MQLLDPSTGAFKVTNTMSIYHTELSILREYESLFTLICSQISHPTYPGVTIQWILMDGVNMVEKFDEKNHSNKESPTRLTLLNITNRKLNRKMLWTCSLFRLNPRTDKKPVELAEI